MEDVHVAIIGAGFGGLGAAIRLREEGFDDLVVLERNEDAGGTWWHNTYPGCACDVPAHLYSFSFALNPDWSRIDRKSVVEGKSVHLGGRRFLKKKNLFPAYRTTVFTI